MSYATDRDQNTPLHCLIRGKIPCLHLLQHIALSCTIQCLDNTRVDYDVRADVVQLGYFLLYVFFAGIIILSDISQHMSVHS